MCQRSSKDNVSDMRHELGIFTVRLIDVYPRPRGPSGDARRSEKFAPFDVHNFELAPAAVCLRIRS